MAKLTNLRERVQQPYRDSLIRTSGMAQGQVSERQDLFVANNNRKGVGETNLPSGGLLPSDNSMIVLALRVNILARAGNIRTPLGNPGYVTQTGDYGAVPNLPGGVAYGNGAPTPQDVWRLCWQIAEGIFWTFGAGLKPSIVSMPSTYFPSGAGLDVAFGGQTDLIHVNNGTPSHQSMLKLARAILLVPRQQIQCSATCAKFDDLGQSANWLTTQGGRNMLSVVDNLNAPDGVQKVVSMTFDGLLSRDVQLPERNESQKLPKRLGKVNESGVRSAAARRTPFRVFAIVLSVVTGMRFQCRVCRTIDPCSPGTLSHLGGASVRPPSCHSPAAALEGPA